MNDSLDAALLLQMSDSNSRKTSVNLQSLDQDRWADEFVGWHIFEDSVVGRLVQDHSVLSLILDLSF